jgi:hypothetical protein
MSTAPGRPKQARTPSGGSGRSVMPRNVHSEGPMSACFTVQLLARTLRKPAVRAATSVGGL